VLIYRVKKPHTFNAILGLRVLLVRAANVKYHANPILALDVDRVYVTVRDMWAFVPEDPHSPYIHLKMELHNNYAYVVVSKETVPSFTYLGEKVLCHVRSVLWDVPHADHVRGLQIHSVVVEQARLIRERQTMALIGERLVHAGEAATKALAPQYTVRIVSGDVKLAGKEVCAAMVAGHAIQAQCIMPQHLLYLRAIVPCRCYWCFSCTASTTSNGRCSTCRPSMYVSCAPCNNKA
jgi:hypothetical protein